MEVPEGLDSLDRLREVLREDCGLSGLSDSSRFFSHEGMELSDSTLVLLVPGDLLYVERDPSKSFDPQNILGQYTVLSPLGKGGFGSVHKAEHFETHEIVAIKYINITDYSIFPMQKTHAIVYHASKVDRIYREAQALKKLSHPNIVRLHHTLLLGNHVVLIMEYVDGGELRQYVSDRGGLTEYEARPLFLQLVDAVNYCHSRSVVHRDLKPENILLSSAHPPAIKIIDFGIAGGCGPGDRTTEGSLPYMPPEVLTSENTEVDPAIDVWAAGVILFVTVTGTFPFKGGR